MTRIAVVGAGLIGRRHIEAVERVEGAELACVVDPADDAKTCAAGVGATWRASLEDMIADGLSDAAILATPNQMHVEGGLACVEAGLPMLIEKPIADDAAAAARLVEAAEAAEVPILVGHHRRHNPIIKAAKARIESGALGRIVAAHAMCWFYKPDDYFNVAWRTKPGAGPIFINLIHDVDLMRHLVGEIVAVQAIEAAAARGHDVEDTAAALLHFENGAVGTITVSDSIVAPWSWELTAAENPAYPETGQSCYLIGGAKGSLEVPSGAVWSQDGERSWQRPIERNADPVATLDPLDAQIAHFSAVARGEAAPLVSGREGLKSLQVIEAIKRAAASGETIRVA